MYSRFINNTLGLSECVPFKSGIFDFLGGLAGAGASTYAAERNYQSQKETNEMNYRIAKETNQQQYQMFQESNAFNRKMFDLKNQWDSPVNQVNLMNQAGLNPALAYGDAATSAGSVSSASAPQMNAPHMDAPQFSDINLAGTIQSIASAAKDMSEAHGNRLGNQYVQQEKEQELANKRATLQNILENSKLTAQQRKNLIGELEKISVESAIMKDSKDSIVRGYSLDNILKGVQAEQARAATEQIRQDTLLKKAQEAFQIDENSRQWSRLSKELQQMDAQISLMATQGTLNEKSAAKVFLETVGTVLDNHQKASFMPYVLKQYKQDIENQTYENYTNRYRAFWAPYSFASGGFDALSKPFTTGARQIGNFFMRGK